MRTLSIALAVSAFVLAPLGAYAAQQTTATQSDFKTSVKAKPMSHKRARIIHSESSHGETTGAGPSHMSR